MKSHTAYLTRICAALEHAPEAKRNDFYSDGFNRALYMLTEAAKVRDPVLDPRPGDVLHSATMFAGVGAEITVRRLINMRHRGAKHNLIRRHVAVHIEADDGRKLEHRGRTYTVDGFERLCEGATVMVRAGVFVAGKRRA
jgi:hypothetical protein